MSTMRGFSTKIKVIARGVETNANELVRKTVITVVSSVALSTPVDTGRARANWRTKIGSPISDTRGAVAPGKKGSTGSQNVGAVVKEAQDEMNNYRKGGQDVWVSNNLPYIQSLNDGSSEQAPAGFVQKASMAAQRAISKSRLVK